MSTTINGTTVRLERFPEDWRRYRVVVLVNSRVRPGLKATNYLDPGKAVSVRHLCHGVGATAALCAEYLGKKYKDIVDPSTCIRDAIQAFGEECRLMGELGRDLPKKLERVRTEGKLNEKEREVLDRMIWLIGRGEALLSTEINWVNEQIGNIHGAKL